MWFTTKLRLIIIPQEISTAEKLHSAVCKRRQIESEEDEKAKYISLTAVSERLLQRQVG